jgi:hypothetical protein
MWSPAKRTSRLCNFLAELVLAVENCYYHQFMLYHEALSLTVDPQHQWRNTQSE